MRWNRVIVGVLSAATAIVVGGWSLSMARGQPAEPSPDCHCPPAALDDAELRLVQSLRSRLEAVHARELAVSQREADIAKIEARIRDSIAPRLEQVRRLEDRLGVGGTPATRREGKLLQLAETLRPLSPRKAAPILANADVDIASTLLQRLGTEKAGALLAQMEPAQAARLVEWLARREKEEQAPQPPAPTERRGDP